MAVRKLGTSWWVDFRFGNIRYRKRSPLNTRAGALEYEAALRQRLARGDVEVLGQGGPTPSTFAEAALKWFQTYVKTNTRLSVQRCYEMILRVHVVPRYGTRRLDSFTSYDLEEYKSTKVKEGLSPKTVNNHLGVLRRFFRSCREWGWQQRTPQVRPLKVPPQRFDFLTSLESNRLLDANGGSRWRDIIMCALRTGMRTGELIGLRWEDVDLEQGVIVVRRSIVYEQELSPKSNRIRHIPMSRDLRDTLRRRDRIGTLVFPSMAGTPLKTSSMRRGLEKACRRAALRAVGWHVLRHSFASQLACEGAPLPAIQSLLGHSTIEMTMRYSHLTSATLKDSVGLLQRAADRDGREPGQLAVNPPSGVAMASPVEGAAAG